MLLNHEIWLNGLGYKEFSVNVGQGRDSVCVGVVLFGKEFSFSISLKPAFIPKPIRVVGHLSSILSAVSLFDFFP